MDMSHRSFPTAVILLCLACVLQGAEPRYEFDQYESVNTWLIPREDGFGGQITAFDLERRTLTLNRALRVRYPGNTTQHQSYDFTLGEGCRLMIENREADLSQLSVGQTVYLYAQGAESPENRQARIVYLLKGTKVSDQWFPQIHRHPDASTGCMFFDDFETGDFTKWNFFSGATSILTPDALSGRHSITMNAWLQGVNKDMVNISGFPKISDVWLKWKMRFQPLGDDCGNFAVIRPFPRPGEGSQIFAVRIYAPKGTEQPQWNLGCQVAQADHQRGSIPLRPGKTYTMKLHWIDASDADAKDGTVETWVDGVADIQARGSVQSWGGKDGHKRFLERFMVGVLHTGDPRRTDYQLVLDDLWIGTSDPDLADLQTSEPIDSRR